MSAGRWIITAILGACAVAAFALPASRSWFSAQWQSITGQPALDQIALICSAAGLLGVSTLLSSWRAIGKAKQYKDLADAQAERCVAAEAQLNTARGELEALKAINPGELAVEAVTATSPAAKEQALTKLKTGLPVAARQLGELQHQLGATEEAARLRKLADTLDGGAL